MPQKPLLHCYKKNHLALETYLTYQTPPPDTPVVMGYSEYVQKHEEEVPY